MEFGIEKCATLIMKNGKRKITERIEQANQERIRKVSEWLEKIRENIGRVHHQTSEHKKE